MHACLGKVIGRWAEHSRPNNLSTEAWDLLGLWYRRVALAGDAAMGLDRDFFARPPDWTLLTYSSWPVPYFPGVSLLMVSLRSWFARAS